VLRDPLSLLQQLNRRSSSRSPPLIVILAPVRLRVERLASRQDAAPRSRLQVGVLPAAPRRSDKKPDVVADTPSAMPAAGGSSRWTPEGPRRALRRLTRRTLVPLYAIEGSLVPAARILLAARRPTLLTTVTGMHRHRSCKLAPSHRTLSLPPPPPSLSSQPSISSAVRLPRKRALRKIVGTGMFFQ
jgi:hypothetical protein